MSSDEAAVQRKDPVNESWRQPPVSNGGVRVTDMSLTAREVGRVARGHGYSR